MDAESVADSGMRERDPRRMLRDETLLVLALSLGASGVSALISFIGSVTKPGGLKDQAATLNASAAPGRPWLDLACSSSASPPRWCPWPSSPIC